MGHHAARVGHNDGFLGSPAPPIGHPASTSEPLALHCGQLGALWDEPGVKKSAPKASDGNMADIAKTLKFLWFLKVFRFFMFFIQNVFFIDFCLILRSKTSPILDEIDQKAFQSSS